jgi:hypothetical protein
MTASAPSFDALTGWRYPRTRPSLPESHASVRVPGLSFAMVPLVRFTGERRKMGEFANGRLLSAVAWSVAAVIVGLNGWLLVGVAREWLGYEEREA